MRLIIAGSRSLAPSYGFIWDTIKMLGIHNITEIVSGAARGVDSEGEHWASHANVPVKRFPADWDKHGKAAGPIRNAEMAKYGDQLLLIWDGESRGSANMKQQMERLKKPVFEVILRKDG